MWMTNMNFIAGFTSETILEHFDQEFKVADACISFHVSFYAMFASRWMRDVLFQQACDTANTLAEFQGVLAFCDDQSYKIRKAVAEFVVKAGIQVRLQT
ncbi:hypothetical protein ABG067_001772 [Albugo candida]